MNLFLECNAQQYPKQLQECFHVQEIAKERCVEVVTVKTQIKGLLGKFGCTRTREIVAMLRQMGLEHLFQYRIFQTLREGGRTPNQLRLC